MKRNTKEFISGTITCLVVLSTIAIITWNDSNGFQNVIIDIDGTLGFKIESMTKAQMMFIQQVTPIDPAVEQITFDRINITIAGQVPDNVNADLVRAESRVLVTRIDSLFIDCQYVDPYSLNISIGAHVRTWNGTTNSWNPISTDYALEKHGLINSPPHIYNKIKVTEITNTRFTVLINASIYLFIPLTNVLWDLGGEYDIQVGLYIKVDGKMLRYGDVVSGETSIKTWGIEAPI